MDDGSESPHPRGTQTDVTLSTLSTPSSIYRVATPDRVGPFAIGARIGGGGMGDVYEALQDEPRRVVAVKLLRSIPSPADLARFRAEAQALGQFSHPGIAQVYEADTQEREGGGVPYIAMEFIPGAKTITEFATASNLTIPQRLALVARVCRAVDHAHAHQVIHRDLKPGNILVDAAGNPKVIDFGVARFTGGENAGWSAPTQVGQIVGTLRYMSPEQVEANPHALDGRTDVYSLGVVLYELLCGRPPYAIAEAGFTEAVRTIQHRPPVPPRRCNPALDPDVEAIVLTALAKPREARYHSAGALADDLERAARGEPPRWAKGGPWRHALAHVRSWARRRPRVAAAACALVAWALAVSTLLPLSRHGWFSAVPFPSPPAVPAAEHLRHARIVAITDSTDMEALAARHGIEGIRNDHVRSWRRMHGALLPLLAAAGPRAIAIDISFPEPPPQDAPFDESLAAGLRAVGGVPTFLALQTWDWSAESLVPVSATVGREATWSGAVGLFDDRGGDWFVEAAAESPAAGFQPSLSLLGYAALRYPALREVQFVLDPHGRWVGLQRVRRSPVNPDIIIAREPQTRLTLSDLRRLNPALDRLETTTTAAASNAVRVGYVHVPAPADHDIDRMFVEYADAFNAGPDVRRELFDGRVVLLANWRSGIDRVPTRDGRLIPGSAIHAAAMAQMLASPELVLARPSEANAVAAGAAAVGAVAALAGIRRRRLGIMLVLALTAGAVALIFAASGFWGYLLHPLPPAASVALAGLLVLAVLGRAGGIGPRLRSGTA